MVKYKNKEETSKCIFLKWVFSLTVNHNAFKWFLEWKKLSECVVKHLIWTGKLTAEFESFVVISSCGDVSLVSRTAIYKRGRATHTGGMDWLIDIQK